MLPTFKYIIKEDIRNRLIFALATTNKKKLIESTRKSV